MLWTCTLLFVSFSYLVRCQTIQVIKMLNVSILAALIEYAVILLLLKKRRKPRRTIDEGLKTLFSNGDATQSKREETRKPVSI